MEHTQRFLELKEEIDAQEAELIRLNESLSHRQSKLMWCSDVVEYATLTGEMALLAAERPAVIEKIASLKKLYNELYDAQVAVALTETSPYVNEYMKREKMDNLKALQTERFEKDQLERTLKAVREQIKKYEERLGINQPFSGGI